MLETILQSINQSLERIAKAQEETNILIKEQMKPIVIGTDVDNAECAQALANTTLQEIEQPISKAEEIPVNVEVQPQLAHGEPVIATVTPVIPTTSVQETFTREQLAVAMSNAVSAGKMNIVQGILQQFGVQALTQINPTDYNKVATMLKEAGVNI